MEDEFVRVTIRYPRKYEDALMMVKEDSCISKNAVIVKAIRELAERVTGGNLGGATPATTNNMTLARHINQSQRKGSPI